MRAFFIFIGVATTIATLGGARAEPNGHQTGKQSVAIRFALVAGRQPAECGRDIHGLGTGGKAAQLHDARLYVSDVALIDGAGRETPVELEQNEWQYASVALLDFENKTGKCVGTESVNDTIRGVAPTGRYKGVSFVVGAPSLAKGPDGKEVVLNHSNFATAPAPLDLQSMSWNWQGGRKFFKIELDPEGGVTRPPPPPRPTPPNVGASAPSTDKPDAPAMADAPKAAPLRVNDDGTITVATWMLHLGSTGCRGDAVKGEITSCASPNRIPVRFSSFSPARQKIVLDLEALFAGIDLGRDKGFSTGCMSGPGDPECVPMFENLGLRLKETAPDANDSGKPSGVATKIFRVEGLK